MRASPSARGNGDQRRHDDGESPSRALLRRPARKTRADGGGRETCASEGQPPEVCARSRRRGPPPPTPAPANSRKARELALIHSQGEGRGWAWKRAGTLMGENEELGKPGQLDVGLPGKKKKGMTVAGHLPRAARNPRRPGALSHRLLLKLSWSFLKNVKR